MKLSTSLVLAVPQHQMSPPLLPFPAKCLSVSSAGPGRRRSSLAQLFGEPVESLVHAGALRGAGGLDVPLRDWQAQVRRCDLAEGLDRAPCDSGRILTALLRYWLRPSFSVISPTDRALGRSCLLANTSKTASFNSSSANCSGEGPDKGSVVFQ